MIISGVTTSRYGGYIVLKYCKDSMQVSMSILSPLELQDHLGKVVLSTPAAYWQHTVIRCVL